MAINSLKFRENMTTELEKELVQGATVSFFEDGAMRAKFVGAKQVSIPEMSLSALADYDRDNGFTRGAVDITRKVHTLARDRARSFQIDREDMDEVGVAGLAGEVLGEFVRTKVVPEVDAYALSQIGGCAVTESQTVTGNMATEAYKIFTTALGEIQDAIGYDEEIVCFADRAFMSALNASPEVSRTIAVSDFKKGEVNLKVKTLDDVAILPVPSSRMYSAYEWKSGETPEDQGGFAPLPSASQFGFIMLPKKAAMLVKKSETLRTFAPDQNIKADAWKFDYRLYFDVFVKNNMKKAIRAFIKG